MKLPKPKFTMAAMVAGISTIATSAIGVVTNLLPLESLKGFERMRPFVIVIVVLSAAVAIGCTVLAAIGRSILARVDNPPPYIAMSSTTDGATTLRVTRAAPPQLSALLPEPPSAELSTGGPMSNILDALEPFAADVAEATVAVVNQNQAAFLAKAKALELSGINELAAATIARLPAKFQPAAPLIKSAIVAAEPQIVNALGGEEQTLLAAAEAQIETWAKAHGG